MKTTRSAEKPKTIDEVAGKPAGSFAKFLTAQNRLMEMQESARKRRIKAVRKSNE